MRPGNEIQIESCERERLLLLPRFVECESRKLCGLVRDNRGGRKNAASFDTSMDENLKMRHILPFAFVHFTI
jgi:hypothetical protein